MIPVNADSWFDIVGLIIVGVAFISAAAIPAWLGLRRQKQVRGEVQLVKDQVVNGHTVPMRDDMDLIQRDVTVLLEMMVGLDRRVIGVKDQIVAIQHDMDKREAAGYAEMYRRTGGE